jgi:hypothetical protein
VSRKVSRTEWRRGPATTWYVSTLVSSGASAFSAATVVAGTLANAVSTGANTVN